jgi:hypothetical protein
MILLRQPGKRSKKVLRGNQCQWIMSNREICNATLFLYSLGYCDSYVLKILG